MRYAPVMISLVQSWLIALTLAVSKISGCWTGMDCDRAKQTNENLKHAAMESTFLLHKPVVYGSSLANGIFLMILLFHIAAAAIAPISAIAAFTVKKGHRAHRHSGQLFAGAMVVVSLTGIILDIVRLCFFVEENHTKYSVHWPSLVCMHTFTHEVVKQPIQNKAVFMLLSQLWIARNLYRE